MVPAAERAKTAGLIIMGAPIAAVIGAPLSGLVLQSHLLSGLAQRAQTARTDFFGAILDMKVLMCGLVYLLINVGIYGILLWLPRS